MDKEFTKKLIDRAFSEDELSQVLIIIKNKKGIIFDCHEESVNEVIEYYDNETNEPFKE